MWQSRDTKAGFEVEAAEITAEIMDYCVKTVGYDLVADETVSADV